MADTRLEDASELATFLRPLKSVGYRSREQVAGVAESAPDALARYLGITVQQLSGILPPKRFPMAGAARRFPLGVALDRIPPARFSLMRAPGDVVKLPPRVNLIEEMRAIRNQGERGTC